MSFLEELRGNGKFRRGMGIDNHNSSYNTSSSPLKLAKYPLRDVSNRPPFPAPKSGSTPQKDFRLPSAIPSTDDDDSIIFNLSSMKKQMTQSSAQMPPPPPPLPGWKETVHGRRKRINDAANSCVKPVRTQTMDENGCRNDREDDDEEIFFQFDDHRDGDARARKRQKGPLNSEASPTIQFSSFSCSVEEKCDRNHSSDDGVGNPQGFLNSRDDPEIEFCFGGVEEEDSDDDVIFFAPSIKLLPPAGKNEEKGKEATRRKPQEEELEFELDCSFEKKAPGLTPLQAQHVKRLRQSSWRDVYIRRQNKNKSAGSKRCRTVATMHDSEVRLNAPESCAAGNLQQLDQVSIAEVELEEKKARLLQLKAKREALLSQLEQSSCCAAQKVKKGENLTQESEMHWKERTAKNTTENGRVRSHILPVLVQRERGAVTSRENLSSIRSNELITPEQPKTLTISWAHSIVQASPLNLSSPSFHAEMESTGVDNPEMPHVNPKSPKSPKEKNSGQILLRGRLKRNGRSGGFSSDKSPVVSPVVVKFHSLERMLTVRRNMKKPGNDKK